VFALLKGKEKTLKPGEEPTFTWFKGGQEFDPDDRFKVMIHFCSFSLVLKGVFAKNERGYRLAAKNKGF